MKGDWFEKFKAVRNLEFNDSDFQKCEYMMAEKIPIYLKYLPKGSTLLECCCGLGCTGIPLSKYYKVTAFDKDERILDYTIKNAMKYSKDIHIVKADFRNIDETFGLDSFKACSSDGVLEHYTIPEIRQLLDLQLAVAPIVFATMPLGDGKNTEDEYGITRHGYTKKQWIEEILKGFDIMHSQTLTPVVKRGSNNEELFIIIKRR